MQSCCYYCCCWPPCVMLNAGEVVPRPETCQNACKMAQAPFQCCAASPPISRHLAPEGRSVAFNQTRDAAADPGREGAARVARAAAAAAALSRRPPPLQPHLLACARLLMIRRARRWAWRSLGHPYHCGATSRPCLNWMTAPPGWRVCSPRAHTWRHTCKVSQHGDPACRGSSSKREEQQQQQKTRALLLAHCQNALRHSHALACPPARAGFVAAAAAAAA